MQPEKEKTKIWFVGSYFEQETAVVRMAKAVEVRFGWPDAIADQSCLDLWIGLH